MVENSQRERKDNARSGKFFTKSKVYELVKLFDDKFILKEEAKLMVWRKRMVHGSPSNGAGAIY